MTDFDIKQFVKDRDEALLTMDLSVINAYLRKYGSAELPDSEAGLVATHKARTGIKHFPLEERKKSRDWLKERGYTHFGDEP